MERVHFYKMTGCGNDFILIDNRKGSISLEGFRPLIPLICRRKLSVGADGVILIKTSDRAVFGWDFFNSDGSEAEMCGNGGRCVAWLAHHLEIAPAHLTFETAVGLLDADVTGKNVKLQLPPSTDLTLDIGVTVDGREFSLDFINTGVPHVVIMADDLEQVDVVGWGRPIRYHHRFQPAGTNVDFIVVHGGEIAVRTYERGVEDETLACGTGAVAAALVAARRGLVGSPTTVVVRSGETLMVHHRGPDRLDEVYLEGRVSLIYEGWLEEDSTL
jgi:diaminopimelate epimerase